MVHPLTEKEDETEILAFLAARPVYTVFMSGLIRDNGLTSPLNRGTFYACRNRLGQLLGVALIGHATLIETRSEAALAAFAHEAQRCSSAHIIMGEQDLIDSFWQNYAEEGQRSRLISTSMLLEQRRTVKTFAGVPELRPATTEDLSLLLPVNAQLSLEECGVNPLERDPEGFRSRLARRIEKGRVWVWSREERILFKADILADTEEAIYLEGIYVAPEERGKQYGQRCMSQLAHNLLLRTNALCLLVNEKNHRAQEFYRRIGYKLHAYFDTIYLHQQQPGSAPQAI
ncbi:MAG: GNAT family N-acetyltransferase [Pyrinomonadaceae bacterium]